MKITDMKFSFVQVECLTEPLRALNPPTIPFDFLLSGPRYEQQFADAIKGSGKCKPPWRGGYGRLFWQRYIQKKPASSKDLWRAMVPLYYELGDIVSADWLDGKAAAKAYLYPWGVGLVVDVAAAGSLTTEEAVQLGFQVERSNKYKVAVGGKQQEVPLTGLVEVLLAAIRSNVYGPATAAGQTGEMFSIVTVLDAEDVDDKEPLVEGSDLHHALEGLVNWNVHWKTTQPKKLDQRKIETKQAPPSHVLYGGRRGRLVWFPGSFRRNAVYANTLTCYHQNLTVASLQTESLCRLVKETGDRLAINPSLADTSVAYQTCAQLAAGLLGRLYGGTSDTYRSHSIRDQIAKVYRDPVSSVRKHFKMPELTPPGP